VRRKLPNTAAVTQQYFGFHRDPMETIPQFLVTESLHFEFVEALRLLKQEKDGTIDEIFIPHLEEDENEDDDDGDTQSRTTKKKSDYKPFLPKIQMVPHLFLWLVVVVDLHRLHCLPRAWILSP